MLAAIFLTLGGGNLALDDRDNQVRRYTRLIEFDYVDWTIDAVRIKLEQYASGAVELLSDEHGSRIVRDFIGLVEERQRLEGELSILLADPNAAQLEVEIEAKQQALEDLVVQIEQIGPLAESILQTQVNTIISEVGLSLGGQAIPPVLFHSTPLPWALIVSPRDAISQEANISLETELTLLEQIELEQQVAADLDVSTLVVPVGGIGSYPTMVAQTSNLNWLAEVIAHEWIHNYLTLRPLGLLYAENQDLRTMNETTANLAGKELGASLIAQYYPELVPPEPAPIDDEAALESTDVEAAAEPPAESVFDFRAEMHETRIRVDQLLEQSLIEEAEVYMEARRVFFWDHGYAIRKLNQAYFAFHGSYADQASGPAGEDPVGEAVRQLRGEADSLKAFINQMAFITSPEELYQVVENLR